jgi:hypothetical protein
MILDYFSASKTEFLEYSDKTDQTLDDHLSQTILFKI